MDKKSMILIGIGVVVLIVGVLGYLNKQQDPEPSFSKTEEVHTHTDFLMYVNGERIRMTDERYQSTEEDPKHFFMHFHDGNDEVIHRHDEGVTLSSFFKALGFTLTDECLTLDTGTSYCEDETNSLTLFVNREPFPTPSTYIPGDEDQILLYYGNPNEQTVSQYLSEITDLACIYSETCPERGDPPTESCVGTCEI